MRTNNTHLQRFRIALYKQSDVCGELKLTLPHLSRKLEIFSTDMTRAVWAARVLWHNAGWGNYENVFASVRMDNGEVEEYALFYSDMESWASKLGLKVNVRVIKPRNVWK